MSSLAVDTNVLVRLFIGDDKNQQETAIRLFEANDEIVIPT